MNKQNITYIIGVVLIITSFLGGYKYGQSQTVLGNSKTGFGQGQAGNFIRGQAGDGQNVGRRVNGQGFGGMVNGEILNQDDKSITVKMRDGSSKIVFYSSSTSIGKTTEGAATDLVVGKQVLVQGTANTDGSVTAQNIQIRPEQSTTQPVVPVKQ